MWHILYKLLDLTELTATVRLVSEFRKIRLSLKTKLVQESQATPSSKHEFLFQFGF